MPLQGKRVVVTRARAQASELSRLLSLLGGEPIEFPVISVAWPEDLGPLDDAIRAAATFDWILFTSVNGVEMFWERMAHHKMESSALAGVRVAAVGPKTAQAVAERGLTVSVTAKEFVGEGLIAALDGQVPPGSRVLLPRADIARKNVPEALREAGCLVTEVDAYRTVLAAEDAGRLVQDLQEGLLDVITFTSASTVHNFYQALRGHDVNALLQGVTVAAIGPVTAQAAAAHDLAVDVMPATYTIEGLVDAIVDHLAARDTRD